jgi:CBS domain-containing protein
LAQAFDFSQPPFDRLTGPEMERFKASLDVRFFREGETILRAGEVPDAFYIVIKGLVREVDTTGVVAVHGAHEGFDIGLLVEGKCRSDFVVEEEAICYVLPVDELLDLTANNKAFAEFFYRDLSLRLEALSARRTIRELQPVMMARVREAYVHPPLFVDARASIFEAAGLMKANRATSLLVRADGRTGIVTGIDMREAVILSRRPVETPVGEIASWRLVTIAPEELLADALLRMTRHEVKRLVVEERGRITGVLEQVDLLSFLSSQSYILGLQVERAASIDDLRHASEQLPRLVQVLHGHGTKIPYITQLVAALTRKIAARLFEMLAPPGLSANACLMVMGSEGRGDQILKTDQDNGMILRDGYAAPELRRFGEAFTEALISFGYPPCPGGIMVSNPAWAKPLAAFRDALRRCLLEPDEPALMNVAILIDAAPVAGDQALLAELKAQLFEQSRGEAAFCARFARAIDSFETPSLGGLRSLLVGRMAGREPLDVKKSGIFPIVHGVRALALERQIAETNTAERIRWLEEAGLFDHGFAVDLIEAYGFLLGLRLQTRLDRLRLEQTPDNLVQPDELNSFERDLLKDSFAIVGRFKELVRHHFHLKML